MATVGRIDDRRLVGRSAPSSTLHVRSGIKALLNRVGLFTRGQVQARFANLAGLLGRPVGELEVAVDGMPAADRAAIHGLLGGLSTGGLANLPVDRKLSVREALRHVGRLDDALHEIRLHIDSVTEHELRSRSCSKEPMTVEWLRQALRPGDVFYDVGANIGAYSLVAAKQGQGKVRVVAFEPSVFNYIQLCRNILLNGCGDCVLPLVFALGNQTRLDQFHYHNTEFGGAFHSFAVPVDYQAQAFQPVGSLGAIGYALDDLVRLPGVPAPTVMKIDVDGLECEILEGGKSVLSRPELRSLLVELNEKTGEADRCIGVLHKLGLVPAEKHHLFDLVHNYVFTRATGPAATPVPGEQVRRTWSRNGVMFSGVRLN